MKSSKVKLEFFIKQGGSAFEKFNRTKDQESLNPDPQSFEYADYEDEEEA